MRGLNNNRKRHLGVARAGRLGLTLLLLAGASAEAQIRPTIPGAVEPGRPIERPPAPSALPQADLEFRIPTPRRTSEPQASDDLKFTIQELVVEGNRLFDRAQLDPLIAPVLGREVSVRDLTAVADAVEAKYRAAGYVLTRAFVPPQRVGNGAFRIRVIEGFIKAVMVEGATPATKARIAYMLEPLIGRPAELAIMERALLLAGDLPGVTASGTLRPGDESGSAELVVMVEEKAIDLIATANNRGSRFSGRGTLFGEAALNGTLGLNEQLAISGSFSSDFEEQKFGGLRWTQPIGRDGLSFNANGSYSEGEPGLSLRQFDTRTRSIAAGAHLAYPLIRERRRNLIVEGGVSWQESTVDLLGTRFSHDEYPSLDLRTTYSEAGALWGGATAISAGIAHGLDAFGASKAGRSDLSRADGRPDFTKLTGELRRLQPIYEAFSLSATALGQYAFDGLFASEEFGLGGTRIGRGYDPSEITGDHGIGTAFELRYGEAFQPWTYQPYAFYDFGTVWNRSGANKRVSLASTGGGMRVALPYGLSAAFEIARQLTHAPFTGAREMETRFLFDVGARF
jgi:hemolysin activation/secretion protein